ncbi:MAG: 30S ribosomal protein S7 [Betaproteobacteria bacterium AqS2]|uniref:Small ribosomal subunit protein uS7 n=1 Tax=Candidatus Amphirhobacter heronislandensis TaxID=1732024 RepID=A0A930UF91_9GAMM|nr:30S ribosomal protein S7 [Betaproteobacteria bacterium AqS2]
MSRRRRAEKRAILPDAKYGSVQVAKFINVVMTRGKKAVAERIVYDALAEIKKSRPDQDPVEVVRNAIDNVRPAMEVKSRRVGGANYQVPTEVRAERGYALAMRWIRDAVRKGAKDQPTARRLAREFMDAAEERGAAFRKKEESHRMAASNKAYSHFRY